MGPECWRPFDALLDMSGLFVLADGLGVVGSCCLERAEGAEGCAEDSWLVLFDGLLI